MRKTFQKLMAEYGVIAVIVYFTIFFATLFAAWAAIQRGVNLAALATRFGLSSNGIVANLGAWTAAYIFTKLLQPVRIGLTVDSHTVACASVRADPRPPVVVMPRSERRNPARHPEARSDRKDRSPSKAVTAVAR